MGQEYRGITNLGQKPTIEGEKPRMGIESYIYNFDEEVYGDFLYVSLYHFVRSEMKFDGLSALKEQTAADIRAGREWHSLHL